MKDLIELEKKYLYQNNILQQELGKKELIKNNIIQIEEDLKKYKNRIDILTKCNNILYEFEISLRTKIITEIEVLVTEGIRQILEIDNLYFKIIYNIKRNIIIADFKLYDINSKKNYDIINSFGGGLIDIIDIILHIIYLYRSNLRKILILDERGKYISNDKQKNFSKFLCDISKKLGIQIILISHKEQIIENVNKVIKIIKKNNKSIVEEL